MTEYISSPYHFRELIDGVAWTDMKAEIMDMLEHVKEDLTTCKGRAEIYRYQGRADALKAILLMPSLILEALEEHSEIKQEDEPSELDDILDD